MQNRVVEGGERSPRGPFLPSRQTFSFPFLQSCLLASTARGEGLHGGLLEGLCGRRRRKGIAKSGIRRHV